MTRTEPLGKAELYTGLSINYTWPLNLPCDDFTSIFYVDIFNKTAINYERLYFNCAVYFNWNFN